MLVYENAKISPVIIPVIINSVPFESLFAILFQMLQEIEVNLQVFNDSQSVRLTQICVDETILRQSESIQL